MNFKCLIIVFILLLRVPLNSQVNDTLYIHTQDDTFLVSGLKVNEIQQLYYGLYKEILDKCKYSYLIDYPEKAYSVFNPRLEQKIFDYNTNLEVLEKRSMTLAQKGNYRTKKWRVSWNYPDKDDSISFFVKLNTDIIPNMYIERVISINPKQTFVDTTENITVIGFIIDNIFFINESKFDSTRYKEYQKYGFSPSDLYRIAEPSWLTSSLYKLNLINEFTYFKRFKCIDFDRLSRKLNKKYR